MSRDRSAPDEPVPVTMGSPRFSETRAGSFRFITAAFPGDHALHPHVHDRTNFTTILSGGFDLAFTSPALAERTRPCPPSTVFVEPAGEKHANYVYEDGAEVLVIQPDLDREELVRPLGGLLESVRHFRHGRIAALARRVAHELGAPDAVTPLAVEAYALEMLATAARLPPERRGGGEPPLWLERARDFVHARFREGLTIADVARAVDVRPDRLARAFRETYGTPLGTYVRRLRIAWVAEQLATTDTPIARIAYEAGYADQSHLTRRFRRATGLTPGVYRERRRSG